MIAFASSFPGSIVPFEIGPGKEMIVQKSGFLASESTVELSVHMQKKLGAGFFGGEGFFNTLVSGPGKVWIQTMPINNVAGAIRPYIPTGN